MYLFHNKAQLRQNRRQSTHDRLDHLYSHHARILNLLACEPPRLKSSHAPVLKITPRTRQQSLGWWLKCSVAHLLLCEYIIQPSNQATYLLFFCLCTFPDDFFSFLTFLPLSRSVALSARRFVQFLSSNQLNFLWFHNSQREWSLSPAKLTDCC